MWAISIAVNDKVWCNGGWGKRLCPNNEYVLKAVSKLRNNLLINIRSTTQALIQPKNVTRVFACPTMTTLYLPSFIIIKTIQTCEPFKLALETSVPFGSKHSLYSHPSVRIVPVHTMYFHRIYTKQCCLKVFTCLCVIERLVF